MQGCPGQCGAKVSVWHSLARLGTAWHSLARHGTAPARGAGASCPSCSPSSPLGRRGSPRGAGTSPPRCVPSGTKGTDTGGAGSSRETSRGMEREGMGLGRGLGGGPWCWGKSGKAWVLTAVPYTPCHFAGTSWRSRLRRGGRGAGELSSGDLCPLLSRAEPGRGSASSLLPRAKRGPPGTPERRGPAGGRCGGAPLSLRCCCLLRPPPAP